MKLLKLVPDDTNIDFLRWRVPFYAISVFLIVASLTLVAVARAIVSEPSLVLADEPTANLDSKTATALMEMLVHMNTEHNVTFIFSTHDKLVMDFSRRLIKLHDGRIVEDVRRE